jgi:hypothetical protein
MGTTDVSVSSLSEKNACKQQRKRPANASVFGTCSKSPVSSSSTLILSTCETKLPDKLMRQNLKFEFKQGLSSVPYYEGRASLHLQDFIGGSLPYIRDKIEGRDI